MPEKIIFKELSYKIVGVLYEVYNELGHGHKERYFENAVAKAFDSIDIKYVRQAPYKIEFKGDVVGRQYFDFLVEDKIVLELKVGNHYSKQHLEQVKQYLHTSKKQLAILANFTPTGVKFMRVLNIQ